MLIRFPSLVALFVLAASLVFGQANQGVGFLFQFPGQGDSGGRFIGYRAEGNPLLADIDAEGPNGSYEILATPDGNRFYILSDGPIQVADANVANFQTANGINGIRHTVLTPNGRFLLANFQTINGITGTIRQVVLTPDGKFLLAATSEGFFILRTETNTLVPTANLNVAGSIVGVAASRDSKRAWVVTEAGFTGTIMAIDLVNVVRLGNPATLPARGQKLYRSPSGLLYITAQGRVMEVNPQTLEVTANMLVNGDPGRLNFTPDGRFIYFVGLPPLLIQKSMFRINVETKAVTEWPPFVFGGSDRVFADILIAGDDRIFAYSRDEMQLYDINTAQFGATPTSLANLFPNNQVLGAAVSQEIPSSRFLFVLIANGNQTNIHRIDLTSNTTSAQILASTTGPTLQFVQIPAQTGAANFFRFNNGQVLNPGEVPEPLIVRVLDGVGKPVYNQTVLFSTDPNSGVTIATPEVVTDAEGYAETTVTLPEDPGNYEILVTAGLATTTFSLTIPEPGGGNPGGPQLVSVFDGNGQLLKEFTAGLLRPLTVKVINPDGSPRSGAPVKFEITDGPGQIFNGDTFTDVDGIASIGFVTANVAIGRSFQSTTVLVTTDVGTTEFKFTTFKVNQDGVTGEPQILLRTPESYIVDIGQGDILPDAITVTTNSGAIIDSPAAIPFIGLRITDQNDVTAPGPAACVGDTLGDPQGVSRCDVQAGCQLGQFGAQVVVGEYRAFAITVRVGPGSAARLNIISGNNQTGFAGSTLPEQLQARVTDNCGVGREGAQVTFTVIQGSATLTNVQAVSDVGGRVRANVQLGATPGPVQIRVSMANAAPIVFDATNQVLVGGVSLISGGNQAVLVNQAFPDPLVFRVRDNNNNPIPGVVVNFSLSGNGALSNTQAITNAQGQVQVNVTAGNSASTVVVSATYLNLSATANLTVRPPGPQITSTSFYNSASFAQGLVPCGLVTVFGNGLASHIGVGQIIQGNPSGIGPLPTSLNGVTITVNGIAAPIQVLANVNGQQQVTFQVPCQTSAGSTTVVATVNSTSTTVSNVPVFQAQPGIFTLAPVNGKLYGAVIRVRDGSLITASNPMRTGEKYILLVGGLGQASPVISTNALGVANQNVNVDVIVGVSNNGVPVEKKVYKQGTIGVYEITFEVPLGAPVGADQPLAIAAVVNNQVVFGNSVLIPLIIAGN